MRKFWFGWGSEDDNMIRKASVNIFRIWVITDIIVIDDTGETKMEREAIEKSKFNTWKTNLGYLSDNAR